MTAEEFSAGDWICRLADALLPLAEAQESFLQGFGGGNRVRAARSAVATARRRSSR